MTTKTMRDYTRHLRDIVYLTHYQTHQIPFTRHLRDLVSYLHAHEIAYYLEDELDRGPSEDVLFDWDINAEEWEQAMNDTLINIENDYEL